MPYVPKISEQLQKILGSQNITVGHKTINNTQQFFTRLKSSTPKNNVTHTVYKIPCKDCPAQYVGQSIQYLKKRIEAHKYSKKASTSLKKHKQDTDHEFDYENTRILAKEKNEFKRKILEMINIKRDTNSVNDRQDIKNLSAIYQPII